MPAQRVQRACSCVGGAPSGAFHAKDLKRDRRPACLTPEPMPIACVHTDRQHGVCTLKWVWHQDIRKEEAVLWRVAPRDPELSLPQACLIVTRMQTVFFAARSIPIGFHNYTM